MSNLARLLYRFRFICLGLIVFITLVAAFSIDVLMDNSIGAWFSKNDPDFVIYKDFCNTYEDGRFIIIALRAPTIFTREILSYIREKTGELKEVRLQIERPDIPVDSGISGKTPDDDLFSQFENSPEKLPGRPGEKNDLDLLAQLEAPMSGEKQSGSVRLVKRVHSLANANKIIGTPDGIEITPLLEDLENVSLEKIKLQVLEDELFNGYLVSKDGRFTTIMVAFEDMTVTETDFAVAQVKKIIGRAKPDGVDVFLCGDIMMMSEFNQYAKQNQTVFPLLIMLIITIFLFLLFRSFSRVFIVLLVVGISLCWTLGFNCFLGFSVNVVTGMLIPLVIILSIADCIHIIEYFDEVHEQGATSRSFVRTVEYIAIPCFITSLTTAIGLVSLATSPIEAVKTFGIGSAAGIMFAFLISIIIVPWLMTLLPAGKKREEGRLWHVILSALARVNERATGGVLVLTVLGFIVFGLGIGWVRIETNQMEWFPKDSPFYLASGEIDRHLSGAGDLEVLLQGGEGSLKDPDILNRMDTLCQEVEEFDLVGQVVSLAGYIKRINKALNNNDPGQYIVPGSRSLIAQELFLFSLSDDGREELGRLVTSDYSRARVSVKIRIQNTASRNIVALARKIEKRAREVFEGTGVIVKVNGISFMYNILYKYLLESQVKSFTIAFFLVTVLLFIIFRSVRYGLLSITPNLLPITFIIGLMGWLGISLNVGTVMVASVALGIALDDTIHYLTRLKKELAAAPLTVSIPGLARETTILTGKAIIFTSVVNI
ncbi:MAG: efflux RND transporter permease subunit, partial [bacterium]|nr:efflux RND transporter permease subunit [bacterium]